MATQPHPQPKPTTPPPPPKPSTPQPAPHPQQSPPRPPNQPPEPRPRAEADHDPRLPIGAKPLDQSDPQAVKFEPPTPAPPRWEDPHAAPKPKPEQQPVWTPKPALDPHAEKPPATAYADGMPIADEQRARAAWVEAHGLKAYDEATDQRPADEKPTFDPHALAGGGAFVTAGTQRQVPGVVPPTKRE